ncbi:hypothetical protein B0H19DRAFT_1174572 [Mycena capillaripes]|nr:hypothetical protein B0H19DRAFT_1174572 [Mycena capillaripes]
MIIRIPDVVRKPPANPLLRREHAASTPAVSVKTRSSADSGISLSQAVLANKLLFHDQRCFLTGEASTELQACHLINAIHTKGRVVKINLKEQVEFILNRQCFHGKRTFFLDMLVNCLALDVHWHRHLDKRGSFCIVVHLEQINAISNYLFRSNQEWGKRARKDPKAPRNLDTSVDPFVVKDCVILVLRPAQFLPDNKRIHINTERKLRAPGADRPSVSAVASWVVHHLEPGSPYLVNDSGHPLHSLPFKTNRTDENALSIFSLLVNAHYKLKAIEEEDDIHPDVVDYADAIETLFPLIFYTPKALNNPGPFPEGSMVSPVPSRSTGTDPTTTGTDPTTGRAFDQSGAADMDVDSSSPLVGMRRQASNQVEGAAESEPESEYESDSESDSEILNRHTAFVQAFDPRLSEAQKAAGIMRGLRMAPNAQTLFPPPRIVKNKDGFFLHLPAVVFSPCSRHPLLFLHFFIIFPLLFYDQAPPCM